MNNYFRTFPALFPKEWKKFFMHPQVVHKTRDFLFVFLVILAGVLLQILVLLNSKYQEAQGAYALRQGEYRYWNSVVLQFPMVPDILFNAAVSSLKVGKDGEAVVFLNKALRIDPLFDKARKLRDEIEK